MSDRDGDVDLVFHFRVRDTGLDCRRRDCDPRELPFNGFTYDGQPITAAAGRTPASGATSRWGATGASPAG